MRKTFPRQVFILLACGLILSGCATTGEKSMATINYDDFAAPVSGLTFQDLEGRSVAVETLWENRRVALVFLRHFG